MTPPKENIFPEPYPPGQESPKHDNIYTRRENRSSARTTPTTKFTFFRSKSVNDFDPITGEKIKHASISEASSENEDEDDIASITSTSTSASAIIMQSNINASRKKSDLTADNLNAIANEVTVTGSGERKQRSGSVSSDVAPTFTMLPPLPPREISKSFKTSPSKATISHISKIDEFTEIVEDEDDKKVPQQKNELPNTLELNDKDIVKKHARNESV